MNKQAYYTQLRKAAGYVSDALLGIVPASIPLVGQVAAPIGSHIGQLDTPTAEQVAKWDKSRLKALLPGVAPYRLNARRRQASPGKTAPIVHQTYGQLANALLLVGAGTAIGGALRGFKGALIGASTGMGTAIASSTLGRLAGLFSSRRNKAQQQKADSRVAAKYLIPGYASYSYISGAKSADRIAKQEVAQNKS